MQCGRTGLASVRWALGLTAIAPGTSYVADAGDGLDLRGTGWFVAADKPGGGGASKSAMSS
ncbi:MAG: hypothetical protein H0T54_09780 [Geodermatophilaceae bacterium]|nr:hypothetical protein [Geodermatophilaceae bacterium]